MTRPALTLAILLTACDHAASPDVEARLEIVAVEALDPGTFGGDNVAADLPDVVADACDLLELPCEAVPRGTPGALALVVTPELFGHVQDGGPLVVGACDRAAWSTANGTRVAHELGRLLGLAEVDDPGNAMHPMGRVAHLDPEQIDTAHTAAVALDGCRR